MLGALASVVALAVSACGSGRPSTAPALPANEVSATIPIPALAKLPPAVRKDVEHDIREYEHPTKHSRVNTIEVYGPGSLTRLEAAMDPGSSGPESPHERESRFYLTVLSGHFICTACKGAWVTPPRGTIEWAVWSPSPRTSVVWGLTRKLPRAVSRLHRLVRLRLR